MEFAVEGAQDAQITVEMEAEGYAADIAAVIRELDEHSWGNIERIESENIPTEGGYGFEIR